VGARCRRLPRATPCHATLRRAPSAPPQPPPPPHLVARVDQALGQLVDVVLHAPKVGIEKVGDHEHAVAAGRGIAARLAACGAVHPELAARVPAQGAQPGRQRTPHLLRHLQRHHTRRSGRQIRVPASPRIRWRRAQLHVPCAGCLAGPCDWLARCGPGGGVSRSRGSRCAAGPGASPQARPAARLALFSRTLFPSAGQLPVW